MKEEQYSKAETNEKLIQFSEEVKALSDEELDAVAGGLCPPDCDPWGNGCCCDIWIDDNGIEHCG